MADLPKRLGIIAGGGDVPGDVAAAAEARDIGVHVLAFEGFTEPELLARYPHDFIQFDRYQKNGTSLIAKIH